MGFGCGLEYGLRFAHFCHRNGLFEQAWVLGRVFYKHRKLILTPGSSHEALAPEARHCSSKESIANEGRTKSG